MKKKLVLVIFVSIMLVRLLWAQTTETYTVSVTPFSSREYDEFSPVFYKNGLVYCTNSGDDLFLNFMGSQKIGTFKIYYIESIRDRSWQNAGLFSKELSTKLNDGLVTFNSSGDTIYYSRNLEVEGNLNKITSPKNKLGIFSATLIDGQWTKVREQRINNEWYNVTAPSLSPDSKRLYFVSDQPGGFGGSDLYYCQWKGDYWGDPVNLGPVINTKGNESYPFISPSGELYFSSDGHKGLGGKDIFFSRLSNNTWITPVHLDPPINSHYDDFGIATDGLMNSGYFSSNRNKSIDIFQFKTNFPQVFYNNIQNETEYCFLFSDSGSIVIDTVDLQYIWNFGDGKTSRGAVVNHCFSGPGDYNIRLDIFDKNTGKLFFTKLAYNLKLRENVQPYINSSEVAIAGEFVEFDGLKSNIPGSEILSYLWDFGDGIKSSGKSVKHFYPKAGEYTVNLGLVLKSDSTGITRRTGVSKKLTVLTNPQDKASFLAKKVFEKTPIPDIRNSEDAKLKINYSAETDFQKDALFTIEIVSSKTKADLNSGNFRNIPQKYSVRELKSPEEGAYSYIVDQQYTLMATYPAYRELVALGLKDIRIRLHVLKDPTEIELYRILKIYGTSAESYFDSSENLKAEAYIMLDQIVRFMEKYPTKKLEVAVYSDNIGSEGSNRILSQNQSQLLVNYLINRGINSSRLEATGFGESRPVASNFIEQNRKLNRRINFLIKN